MIKKSMSATVSAFRLKRFKDAKKNPNLIL